MGGSYRTDENKTNPELETNPKLIEMETDPKLIDIQTEPNNILDQTDFLIPTNLPEPLIPLNDTKPKTIENETSLDLTSQEWYTEIVHLGSKDDCSILVKIGERHFKTLWDSGAGKCVISYDKYQTIPNKFKTELVPSNILIKAANGSIIENRGECDITFRIGPEKFTFTFLVSNALTQDIILGYNFSRAYHIGTNWNNNDEMCLTRNSKHLTATITTKAINAIVQCAESIVIPPRSNAMIKCRAPRIACQKHFEKTCLFEPSSTHKSENAACHTYHGTVLMDNDVITSGVFEIAMTNTSWKTVKIRRNTNMGLLKSCIEEEICTIHEIITLEKPKGEKKSKEKKVKKNVYAIPIRNNKGEIEINNVVMKEELPHFGINEIGPQEDFVKFVKPKLQDAPVNARVLQDLENLLNENPKAFATDETEIGTTPLIEMDIDTGDHPPIAKRPYVLALKHYEWAKQEIDKLLKAGVIRESHSSWSAPVVIVPKSNGEKRLCVDFRALNKITRTYIWPMPRAEDIFAKLGKAKFFTTLDLRAGYHHIALTKDSIPKTGFCINFGKYEYLKVPFGLAQAPAYFQNLMNKVLAGLPFAIAYLDDIIIFSETPEEHLKHIKIVLQRLQAANLKMKRSKCSFFKKELHYLGHLLTTKGLKPQPEKVKAISELKAPTTPKGVREFLGMVGYYRKFISRFADAARPLTKLVRRESKFEWTKDCQVGFDYLRTCLMSDPILKYPDPNKRYVMFTDASDQAAAGVLCQEYPDSNGKTTEHPIAYLSAQFTDTQFKWSTIVKEGYVIYYCVKKWRPYLEGAEILLKSDAKSLEKFLEGKTDNNKLDRWSLELQGRNIKCVHIPGTQNRAADCLSRLPFVTRKRNNNPLHDQTETKINCIDPEDQDLNTSCRLCEVNLTDTKELQDQDRHCIRVKSLLQNPAGKLPDKDRYFIKNDLLCYKTFDMGKEHTAVVVPSVLIPTILKEMHDKLGHFGVQKTYSFIKKYYFWPKMMRHIQSHVSSCSLCIRENSQREKYKLQTTEIPDQPFAKVGIDLIVDLDVSHSGNKNILVVVDHLTGFPIAVPLKNKEASTVVDAFYDKVILEHTAPHIILSDNGKEFVNETLTLLCDTFNIEHHYTSPYFPQSNGKTENFNKFLKASIRKLCQDDKQGWDQVLGQILMAYRCCPHTSTGESPFFLVYNRDPCLPVHKLIKPTIPYRGNFDIGYKIEQSQIALTTAAKNLEKKRALQKKPYENRPSDHSFKVGDLVLLYKHNKDKLDLQWEPGYRIVELQSPWTAKITNKTTGEPKRVNVRDLRLKDPAEDWDLKAESMGRGAKFVNDPSNLPDIDWTPENDNLPDNDNGNPPDKDKDTPDNVQTSRPRRTIKPPQRLIKEL